MLTETSIIKRRIFFISRTTILSILGGVPIAIGMGNWKKCVYLILEYTTMKKLLLTLTLSFFASCFAFAQWDSVGNGVRGAVKYISAPVVYTQTVYNGSLYIGGEFDTVGGQQASGLGEWNGITWNVFGKISTGGTVVSSTVYNGNLVIGGYFDSVAHFAVNDIAEWNGSTWSGLGKSTSGSIIVEALTVYKGNLIAGGLFAGVGSIVVNNIAEWNGSAWVALGNGVFNKSLNKTSKTGGGIYALSVYNGNLYAGGKFDSAGTVAANNLAMWNGTTWSAVGTGLNDSTIQSLTVYNNELYAGGFLGSYNKSWGTIDRWNGINWYTVGNGFLGNSYNGSKINALCVYDSAVYATGAFDSIGGIAAAGVASWNGVNWARLSFGINGQGQAISVYDSELYVAGLIHYAGGFNTPVNDIAKWCGICPVGIDALSVTNSIQVFPNPSKGLFNLQASSGSSKGGELYQVQVYNLLGEKVYAASLNNSQGGTYSIDLTNQSEGMYFYRITTTDGKSVGAGKLIIEK